jgi:hypothetical protein
VKRYLAKTRKRTGGFTCLRCTLRFDSRNAYDRHIVWYPADHEDWCHLPGEVGLVAKGGWYRLPTGTLRLDPGIRRNGGTPSYPNTAQARKAA